jgi:cold shock protein
VGYAGLSKLLEIYDGPRVKSFNPAKGYGFIQPQDGGRDVFIYILAVEKAGLPGLNEGQVVEYELVTNRGKTSAAISRSRADRSAVSHLPRPTTADFFYAEWKAPTVTRGSRGLREAFPNPRKA